VLEISNRFVERWSPMGLSNHPNI